MEAPGTTHCICADPTPIFGNITLAWYCYECGEDVPPEVMARFAIAGTSRTPSATLVVS